MLALHCAALVVNPLLFERNEALPREEAKKSPKGALNVPTKEWKDAMAQHAMLNDMTTDEWQAVMKHRIYEQHQVDKAQVDADRKIASDNHKLKPLLRIADHLNSTVYNVLAFEGCATACDVKHWCQHPPCDLSGVTDALLSHVSNYNMKDVWSSCHSGCSMGLRSRTMDQCKASCQEQAKSPWFCSEACSDYASKSMLYTPKDAYTKRLDARTGFWDRDELQSQLDAQKAEVARLSQKLMKCEQGQKDLAQAAKLAKLVSSSSPMAKLVTAAAQPATPAERADNVAEQEELEDEPEDMAMKAARARAAAEIASAASASVAAHKFK